MNALFRSDEFCPGPMRKYPKWSWMWHSGARMLAAANAPRSHRPAYDTSPSRGESSSSQCSARKIAFENSPSQFLHWAAVVMKITSSVSASIRFGVRAIASGTGWPVIG